MTQHAFSCSFCGLTKQAGAKVMISGPGVFICDQCVEICTLIVADEIGKGEPSAVMATANFRCGSLGEEA